MKKSNQKASMQWVVPGPFSVMLMLIETVIMLYFLIFLNI